MPKGIPNTPSNGTGKSRKIQFTLSEADYAALERLATEQYRTPPLQAAYLLARVLREAGLAVAGATGHHAERILERANARNTPPAND